MSINVKDISMRVGYYALPILQMVAASVAVHYVIRGVDRLFRR